jgi:HSP20 family protein
MTERREDREQRTSTVRERPSADRGERARQPVTTAVERQGPLSAKASSYLTPLAPIDMFRRISNEMDRLFGAGIIPSWGRTGAPTTFEHAWSPQVEMLERDGKLIVRADLPGLNKEDVKVELRDDVLTIEGERHHEREEKSEGLFHSERSYGSFFRSIPLPEGATGEHCDASFRNGVLEVTMDAPMGETHKGRRIEVK